MDVLIQRGPTCDFLSWFYRLGLIFKFFDQVFWGGSQLIVHSWLRISHRLGGVWGDSRVYVRAVVLNCSWWWIRNVGLWISLGRSWLLLGGWNCGLLRWSRIQILVGILMGQARYCLWSPQLYFRNRASHLLEVLVWVFVTKWLVLLSWPGIENIYGQWGLFLGVDLNVGSTCPNHK